MNLTRRQFGQTVCAAAAQFNLANLARSDTATSATRPNVIIIQPDQHRGTIMRCAGDEQVMTPNLDRLAAEGVRFVNCASSSPVCSPFRGTFQTGLYPHTHGVDRNNVLLDPTLPTFAEIFSDHGYATGYIGKWHLDGGIPPDQPGGYIEPGPRRQGWQEWYGYEKGHEYLNVWKYDDNRKKVRVQGYGWEPAWHTDMALDFVRRHRNMNKPWLYYVAYGPPHLPQQCPERFLKMYDPNAFQLPPDVARRLPPAKRKELRTILQCYYAQVTAIDFEVGRLLRGLRELGVDRDTIVLYTSDHGDKLGSHWSPGLRLRGKAAPFASAFRIPLMVRWPGRIKPGQVHDCLVSSVDLTPTILDLAGLPVAATMQGDSMAPWCLTGKGKANEAVYLGLHGSLTGDTERAWRAVWDGRYIYAPGKFHVLYDHQEDPHEMKNLINLPQYADVRKRLDALLLHLAERTQDPFLPHLRNILSS